MNFSFAFCSLKHTHYTHHTTEQSISVFIINLFITYLIYKLLVYFSSSISQENIWYNNKKQKFYIIIISFRVTLFMQLFTANLNTNHSYIDFMFKCQPHQ